MSIQIEDLDDLKSLLKACKLSVGDVEELKSLLAAINANYNPDAARVKVAKRLGIIVPCAALGIAGAVSYFLNTGEGINSPFLLAALAVLWGVAGLVSIMATIFTGAILLSRRASEQRPTTTAPGPFAHAFTERPINAGRTDGPH